MWLVRSRPYSRTVAPSCEAWRVRFEFESTRLGESPWVWKQDERVNFLYYPSPPRRTRLVHIIYLSRVWLVELNGNSNSHRPKRFTLYTELTTRERLYVPVTHDRHRSCLLFTTTSLPYRHLNLGRLRTPVNDLFGYELFEQSARHAI